MSRRSSSILSQINKTIGSVTHWIFRGLIFFIAEKFDIEVSEEVSRFLAYILTGLFLVIVGVWHYLPWLPGIKLPSIDVNFSTLLVIVGVILSYLGWREAHKASVYAKEALDDSRSARINLRYTHDYGLLSFVIGNIGKDMAKNLRESSGRFNSVPDELLASIVPPVYDPRQAINHSAVTTINLKEALKEEQCVTAVFEYENSFGNKFVSKFKIANPQKIGESNFVPYKVSEENWISN